MISGIKVLFVSRSWPCPEYKIDFCAQSNQLMGQIAKFQPDVIVSSDYIPGALQVAPFELRKRWLHIDPNSTAEAVCKAVESCYAFNLWSEHPGDMSNPIVSIYTGSYNTGDFLRDTYQSLKDQTYANWEWVVVDDESTDGTWERLRALADEDIRVRPFRVKHNGKIGYIKGVATSLSRGKYLIELDHDDMLTDTAVQEVKDAFDSDPSIGMVYTNCANFFENGAPHMFGDEFWKPRYRDTVYRGKTYKECLNPDIYDRYGPHFTQQFGWFLTVGPNHIRAYRADKLHELGGYNPGLAVADDWDVYARFFLRSKCKHINKMLYLYRFHDGFQNTTFTRNKSIQDNLSLGRNHYAGEFESFNQKRLTPDKELSAPVGKGVLLTVAIPSVSDRVTEALPLLTSLFKQADGKPVEILVSLDNRMSTVSEKRNKAIQQAHGKFMAFVDDDDMVAEDYVDSILKAIRENPSAQVIVYDVFVGGYALDGSPATEKNPAVNRVNKQGLEYTYKVTPDAFFCGPSQWMTWRTEIMRAAPPYPNKKCEDVIWAREIRKLVNLEGQVRVDKTLYFYKFDSKKTTQGKAHLAAARREQLGGEELVTTAPANEVKVIEKELPGIGFVIASRTAEKAEVVRAALGDVPVYMAVGAKSILEAYEAGRQHFTGVGRVVYMHDDVQIADVPAFCQKLKDLPNGLHGVCGSAHPEVLNKGPWWDFKPCYGRVMQGVGNGQAKLLEFSPPNEAHEVQWLDGLLLVAVNQNWSWKVRGNPEIWHGYDWLACKRTQEAGFKCHTLSLPLDSGIRHEGLARMEGYTEALTSLRSLTKSVKDRRDFPNIFEHLPIMEKLVTRHSIVLDIGCREGAGTDAFLRGVEEHGGEVWSVDLDDYAVNFVGHKQWHFIQSDSLDEKKILEKCNYNAFDIVFIDTDHSYERTLKELVLWCRRVVPGGHIVLHDHVAFPGVGMAIQHFLSVQEKMDGVKIAVQQFPNCNGLTILTMPPVPEGVVQGAIGPKGLSDEPGPRGKEEESLSVIILDWNTPVTTQACVDSVKQFCPQAEVIVVENGEKFPCKGADKTLTPEINLGYAAGMNYGVVGATKKFVCLLNSDALVNEDLLKKLISSIRLGKADIVGPYSNCAKEPQGNHPRENCPKDDLYIPLAFVCVMMEKRVFEDIGGLNPRLCTFEDDDFCRRAQMKGYKTMVAGGAWVYHQGHSSFKANKSDVWEVMRENKAKFARMWPRIGVIALTKNEIDALPGFIEQFKGLTRNFMILDSGSTDGTVEWAKSHGVFVASRDFTRFDEQRNAAIEQFPGEVDWLIMLDPDERLDPHTIAALPDLVRTHEFDIYLTRIFAKHPDGSSREWIGKPFLWRNLPEIRWALPVHEKLIGSLRQAFIVNGQIDHIIALHKAERRATAESFYAALAGLPRQDVSKWPIIDYEHPMHPGLRQINVGPKVTVVIPTYKREMLRIKAVESVRGQDYRPFEIIVVGDGPDSWEDMKGGLQGDCDWLTYCTLPVNHGAGGAVPRNYGMMLASGQWIAFLDDDNAWAPGHLSSLMAVIEREGAEYAISSMLTLGKELIFTHPEKGQVDSSCILFHKSLVTRFGWFKTREEVGYAHDWEFVAPWVSAGIKWAATKLPTCLYTAETSGQEAYLRQRVGVT